jgi:hypothetical protein
MIEDRLGPAIKRAVVFLQTIHEDVYSMVHALDGLLAERDWLNAMGNRISDDLGNSMEAWAWVLRSLARIYVPRGLLEQTSSALCVLADFAPETQDEPMVLVAGLQFSGPVPVRDDIWARWMQTDRAFQFLSDGEARELPRDLLDADLFPKASRGRAFALPLCELVDGNALRARVVDPGLQLVSLAPWRA